MDACGHLFELLSQLMSSHREFSGWDFFTYMKKCLQFKLFPKVSSSVSLQDGFAPVTPTMYVKYGYSTATAAQRFLP